MFDAAVKGAAGASAEVLEAAITASMAASEEAEAAGIWIINRVKIRVVPQEGGMLHWSWIGEAKAGTAAHSAADIAVSEDARLIAVTNTHSASGDIFFVEVIEVASRKRVWLYKGVAPSIAFSAGRLWVLEADAPLQYSRLVSFDAVSGKGRKVHYEEGNPSVLLDLVVGEGGCVFMTAEEPTQRRLYHISEKVVQLSPEAAAFFPVGSGGGSSGDSGGKPCYFIRKGGFDAPWEGKGGELEGVRLPGTLGLGGLEAVSLAGKFAVVRVAGERVFVSLKGGKVGPRLYGSVQLNRWGGAKRSEGVEVLLVRPGCTPVKGVVDCCKRGGHVRLVAEPPATIYGGQERTGFARSKDGTAVRWLLSSSDARAPRGLIVVVYGAYGLPTVLNTTHWRPYLERGFAIGFAMVRGGGDDGDAWAAAGRRAGKERGVEDLEAAVLAMRRELRLGPTKTCIYGRSAGGYIVGAAVARNPGGELFGAAYAEVPYVDVLRTSSNPRLYLTELEYDEFGDPMHRIEDFEAMLRLSPVDALGPKGAPGVMVVCRTATNDVRVFAYESAKWVDALRGSGAAAASPTAEPKLLGLIEGQGHFTRGRALHLQRAQDFLLLSEKILGSG